MTVKALPTDCPKLLNLNQEHLSKNRFSGRILIRLKLKWLTFLKEMLELPNFCLMTKSTIQIHSRDKIFLVSSLTNYDVITFISK